MPLTRSFTTIWINQQTAGAVRATVHSLLAQAKYLGEIVCGMAVTVVADLAAMPSALVICGGLLAIAVLLVHGIGLPGAEPASSD